MKHKTKVEYAKFMRISKPTALKYIKFPKTMTIEQMQKTDKFFGVVSGTTYMISEEVIEANILSEIINLTSK